MTTGEDGKIIEMNKDIRKHSTGFKEAEEQKRRITQRERNLPPLFLMGYLRKYAAVIIPGAAGFRSMAKMKKLFYNFG